jgi:ABC-type glycerol-3-phosphate transport system permease component
LLAKNLQNLVNQQFGPMFASYVISAVPLVILFSFTMKLFIRGLASGAIKA